MPDSSLYSISNYKLISGVIPPMNEIEWNEAFDLYKQYPEFQKLNYNMNLEEFKGIYSKKQMKAHVGIINCYSKPQYNKYKKFHYKRKTTICKTNVFLKKIQYFDRKNCKFFSNTK